jgi:hypothetical protein
VNSKGEKRRDDASQDARWYPVYVLVLVFTVIVITALWLFSKTFSS